MYLERKILRTYQISIRRSCCRWCHRSSCGSRGVGAILTPTAFDRPSVNHLSLQLNDSHSSVFVCIQLDESETAVCLHTNLRQVTNGLEQRDKICLGAIRYEVSDVYSCVVSRRLLHDNFVRERPSLEVNGSWGAASDGTTYRSRCRSRACRTLRLLIGPIDPNGARTKPFSIHGSNCLFCVGLVAESEETIAAGFS